MKRSYITATDQFCGAGGSTIGGKAGGVEVILAMNHWKLACETYGTNNGIHPVCTDVSATDPRRYPTTDILITSPECTNHSLAKGQKRQLYHEDLFGNVLIDPAEERSRATMWDVPRFAEFHDYRLIIVENVVDAGKWRLWDSWLHAMHAMDYEHKVVFFNSMFAWPTPQSRDRMYTIFWKKGNRAPDLEIRPRAYCHTCGRDVEAIQTWKKLTHWGRYGKERGQYFYRCPFCTKIITPYYYAAFNAIDWSIPSERIGDRKKPLKPKTLERIKYGLDMYGRKPMIVTTRYTSGVECRARNAFEEPIPTQPGDPSHAVVFPWLVETGHTQGTDTRASSVSHPAMTQTTRQTVGLVAFLSKQYTTLAKPIEMTDPMGVVTTNDHHALITNKAFLTYYYGTDNAGAVTDPIHTITTKDRAGLVELSEKPTIDDLTFRMLQPREIGKAMAFPGEYVVLGNAKEQVKQYGNAVTPPVMEMLVKRCVASLVEQ